MCLRNKFRLQKVKYKKQRREGKRGEKKKRVEREKKGEHVLMWIGVMTPFSHFEMTESDLIQRTSHVHVQSVCCANTPAVKSTVLQDYSASYQELHQVFLRVQVLVRVQTTSSHKYLVPSCHVPRCPSTSSDLLLHASYCEYRLTTRSAHVVTHVIQSADEAKQTRSSARCSCTSCHNSCFTSTPLSETMAATPPFRSSNRCRSFPAYNESGQYPPASHEISPVVVVR